MTSVARQRSVRSESGAGDIELRTSEGAALPRFSTGNGSSRSANKKPLPKKEKKDRLWKQQIEPSWEPTFTPKCAVIPLILIAIIFLPLGGYLYWANTKLNDVIFDYTECQYSAASTLTSPSIPNSPIKEWSYNTGTGTCTIRFEVFHTLTARVFMYIRITGMYQNHRLYVRSEDAGQLKGSIRAVKDMETCSWLQYANCDAAKNADWKGGTGKQADHNPDCWPEASQRDAVIRNAASDAQYYPCGLIANSMFTDSITNLTCISSSTSTPCRTTTYDFTERGIAWEEDIDLYGPSRWKDDASRRAEIPTKLIPPPAWRKAWPSYWKDGYTNATLPDLRTWERFQVWMRKAGLSTFRKLWGRNDEEDLEAGVWEVSVRDVFDVRRIPGVGSRIFSARINHMVWESKVRSAEIPFDLVEISYA
ncbi:hypothetical protein HK097_004064 [Rhizophlyctis rosea]|uniref:Uncharacterized protein n=1 Tax=Rhizophlyctis rosea TaxID=64517 RepID=A0AAD5SL67_9FUNG|nr:hypothetical protein HK097_004064 [Rhizophlyctis rosea]